MSTEKLIVFVKAPQPGAVKTRLARTLGADAACAAYRRLVETLLRQLAPLPHVELRFAPDDAARALEPWRRNSWTLVPQGAGDLGARLIAAFQDAFSVDAQRVVVIGSDCPAVSVRDIEDAWAALHAHDVVLGPATDGGYWLVGLRTPQPVLFGDVTWSTAEVLAETLHRARAAKLNTHLLRRLTDVDTEAEWHDFLKQ